MKKPWYLDRSKKLFKKEPGGYLYGPYPHFYIEEQRKGEYSETSDIHRCIWIWKRHAEHGINVNYKLNKKSYKQISYEKLLNRPEKIIKEILIFINENRTNSFSNAMKIANQGYKTSIGRWKNELNKKDILIIQKEAGPILEKLGYK